MQGRKSPSMTSTFQDNEKPKLSSSLQQKIVFEGQKTKREEERIIKKSVSELKETRKSKLETGNPTNITDDSIFILKNHLAVAHQNVFRTNQGMHVSLQVDSFLT